MNGNINHVEKAQANAPAQIVASLLNNQVSTPSEAQANLAAAASVLQSSKIGKVKPDSAKLKAISDKLLDDQRQYPELPQVWQTTGIFINYKFQALLISAIQVDANAAGKTCHPYGTIPGVFKYEKMGICLTNPTTIACVLGAPTDPIRCTWGSQADSHL